MLCHCYFTDAALENESEDLPATSLCDADGIVALGMESETIPDSSLTASSAFEMGHVGPHNARYLTIDLSPHSKQSPLANRQTKTGNYFNGNPFVSISLIAQHYRTVSLFFHRNKLTNILW